MFEHFQQYAGDPILSLQQTYAQDARTDKVNLSIGLYYDAEGRIPRLASVRQAETALYGQDRPCVYLPMSGAPEYRGAVEELLFGADNPVLRAGKVATIQTVGGSGAVKVGSDVLRRYFPDSEAWICDPTWDNHVAIFEGSGFTVRRYPYFDPATRGVDFAGMMACLSRLPARAIVLMHPCCHNPTGADLTRAQWDEAIALLKERRLIPFLDSAYQGLGDGVEADAYAVRAMAQAGLSFLVSHSFSKTFSLYNERCGALSIVCQDADEAARALGQMEQAVRRNYSSPPAWGEVLVSRVLRDPVLKPLWLSEVEEMRQRIVAMRRRLHDVLLAALPGRDFSFLLSQRGMFSYTGLSAEKVRQLREQSGIYLVDSGRLCVTGLNAGNVERVGNALAKVLA